MIQDFDGNDAVFEGNTNAEDIHTNVFLRSAFIAKGELYQSHSVEQLIERLQSPVTARQIRIWPIENGYETEDYKLYKSMRVEIYGCNKDGSDINDGDQESLFYNVIMT